MESYDRAWVDAQVTQAVGLWNSSAAESDFNAPRYSSTEQEKRERAYDDALSAVEQDLQNAPGSAEALDTQDRIESSFARFSARALDLDGEAIELLTQEFLPVGTKLAQWGREFDPALSMTAIIQAARNAWTACGLQPLLGAHVDLTPSILGYSLLYPYSDNYLDDEEAPAEMKLRFSQRFRRRLLGESVPVADERERAMWALIALIETQYSRPEYPQVFECLLAIHQAQEKSISQVHGERNGRDEEYLRLSCAKGGTSVLADACLAYGSLTKQEGRFAFEWGVLLQLGDDLQDVRDDLGRGSLTLFSRAASAGRLMDGLAVQLLNFSEKVGRSMDELPHGSASLKGLLKMSWRSLIIRAVADSHEFFLPGFYRKLSCILPSGSTFCGRAQTG